MTPRTAAIVAAYQRLASAEMRLEQASAPSYRLQLRYEAEVARRDLDTLIESVGR